MDPLKSEYASVHQDHLLGRARDNVFLRGGDVEEAHPLLGPQSVTVQKVNHGITAALFARIAGREVDEHFAVGRIAFQISFE
jgi:hypothetical protein